MPIEEMILNMMLVIFAFAGTLGLASMFLSHRRKMAEIKYGKDGAKREPALERENVELRETVSLMQDRLAVLEQIATDPATRTAREIEQLR
jgi:hypothetical protein